MKDTKYTELNSEEKTELGARALKFYKEHTQHIKTLLRHGNFAVPPSGSDMFHPELWKSIHWRWFINLS